MVAVVTGASSGIGAATARRLAREPGAQLVLVARREERLRALADELGGATVVAVDLLEPDAPQRVAAAVEQAHGRLDLLVNNAGAGWHATFADAGWEGVQRHMDLNFNAVVRLTEALLPLLRRSAPSAIVNVSSVAGRVARRKSGAYSASKFALAGWSDALAAEERAAGVHVGLVLPGFVATEGFPQRNWSPRRHALGRVDAGEGRRGDRRRRARRARRALRAAAVLAHRRRSHACARGGAAVGSPLTNVNCGWVGGLGCRPRADSASSCLGVTPSRTRAAAVLPAPSSPRHLAARGRPDALHRPPQHLEPLLVLEQERVEDQHGEAVERGFDRLAQALRRQGLVGAAQRGEVRQVVQRVDQLPAERQQRGFRRASRPPSPAASSTRTRTRAADPSEASVSSPPGGRKPTGRSPRPSSAVTPRSNDSRSSCGERSAHCSCCQPWNATSCPASAIDRSASG